METWQNIWCPYRPGWCSHLNGLQMAPDGLLVGLWRGGMKMVPRQQVILQSWRSDIKLEAKPWTWVKISLKKSKNSNRGVRFNFCSKTHFFWHVWQFFSAKLRVSENCEIEVNGHEHGWNLACVIGLIPLDDMQKILDFGKLSLSYPRMINP
jgi:hypothetical protein